MRFWELGWLKGECWVAFRLLSSYRWKDEEKAGGRRGFG